MNATVPALTRSWPVKAFAPESVSWPDVDLMTLTEPPSTALTEPARRSKSLAEVRTPVDVPTMAPELRTTDATVSVKVATSSVPPATVTGSRSAKASFAPRASVPAETVRPPAKPLAPDSVTTPVPVLVTEAPAPVMAPETTTLPAPPKVSAREPASIAVAPPKVRLPASDWTRASPARVMRPLKLLAPLRLRSAPAEPAPTPSRVTASARTAAPPWN